MIIKYTIQKHSQLSKINDNDIYVVWQESKTEHGIGAKGVFKGTRQECKDFLEQLKKEN